ncbi:hypothetical protein DM860_007606 [Cuscuta australis]|uniref:RRM domain-containing protein n=1 Tax=Cuscuta australis TaxID=267555 RepID=A0A328E870_9ASTE|nr:hypothetical protein DM860_007606 [Cuscuta australis]
MATITVEDLHLFHSIDRKIFSRLVVNSARNPAESLLVMAFWLWLEDLDFPGVIDKMLALSDSTVNALADEAAACLKRLESSKPNQNPRVSDEGNDMPLTSIVMGRAISSKLFCPNKFTAISGIKSFLNKVCAIVFADILEQVLPDGSCWASPDSSIPVPGFPHPTFGSIAVVPRSRDSAIPNAGLWGWSMATEPPVDDRTMFLTFSRGYPVTEEEVRELFNSYYGDCVEAVRMVPPAAASEQPLYARLVVRSVGTIDRVLSGGPIAKFRVNGKHVWARKYERRDGERITLSNSNVLDPFGNNNVCNSD